MGRLWTDEERLEASLKAKARQAAKLAATLQDEELIEQIVPEEQVVVAPVVTMSQEQFDHLLQRIEDLESVKQPAQPGVQLNAQGGVTGVIERYSVNPAHYKNPIEMLYDLPQLKRYAMRENYEIRWTVTPVKYQTASGTWFVEPKFELILLRRMFDDEDPTIELGTKIVLGRAAFFEDPPANIIEAEQAGVSSDDLDSGEFQEKMRMYRYAFWLMERLNPRKPQSTKQDITQKVIGGKMYEMEVSVKPY